MNELSKERAIEVFDYCPKCGAKMEVQNDN